MDAHAQAHTLAQTAFLLSLINTQHRVINIVIKVILHDTKGQTPRIFLTSPHSFFEKLKKQGNDQNTGDIQQSTSRNQALR